MRVSSIRWGIIWIGIGFLFLAINFEVLDRLVFPALFSLWPILLIAIGVELIFRKTKFYFLTLLSPLLIAAAFIFAAVYAGGYTWSISEFWRDWSWTYEGRKQFSEDIRITSNIDTVFASIELGDSDFDISRTTDSVFSVSANYFRRSPILTYRAQGTAADIEFRNRDKDETSIFSIGKHVSQSDFKVFEGVKLSLEVNTDNDNPEFDLSDLNLENMTLSLNSKETRIKCGRAAENSDIKLIGKSDKLVFILPRDFGLEILMNDFDIKRLEDMGGLVRFSDGLRTQDFQDSEQKATAVLSAFVKKIEIQRI
jgi:hypothetical protein